MTWEMLYVVGILLAALIGFWTERFPADQIAVAVFALLLGGTFLPGAETLPSVDRLVEVFSSPAPLTIAALFIVSAALENTGALERLAAVLQALTRLGYKRFLVILILFVAVISGFINNTPVVMVFMPVVLGLARSLKVPASKLLIPLSYASIFGGTCTLVGTSTNILASDILTDAGMEAIGMFELAWVGLPLTAIGCVYLVTIGHRLLPERETLTSILTEDERKEFILEAFVQPGSSLVGKSVAQSDLRREHSLRVLEIIRGNVALEVDPRTSLLEAGDRLVLAARPKGVAHARSIEGISLTDSKGYGLEAISAHEGFIVEGVVGPTSQLVGQTLQEINFRQRYRVVVVAVHRRGVNLRAQSELRDVVLRPGDLLLMMGTEDAIGQLRQEDDVLLLDHPRTPSVSLRKKRPIVTATAIGIVAFAALGWMPIVATALIGVAVIFLTGSLKAKEGYANVEWSILVLIYGMLGLGTAMQTTGTADLIAGSLTRVASSGWLPAGSEALVLLGLIYLVTMVLTETLSNNATIVLMAPIALSLGAALEVDPRAFVLATCVAASASFSTPIGYQTNTYVYGVGGYRFGDFTKVGLPLNLLAFLVSVVVIPRVWGF